MIYRLGDRSPVFEGDGHFVAGNASIIGDVRIGDHASIWFNSVLRGDNDSITIGARSNVQDGSVLHTDIGYPLTIGSGVTVGHKVMLHGCTIDSDSLIGMGSTILNGAVIGRHCIVGANALVTENKHYGEGMLILGSPARAIRELTTEEIAEITYSAEHYVTNAARYARELQAAD